MNRLHVVMLAPFGIRPKGTLVARMLPLAQALVQHGHRVTIVAPAVANPEDAGTRIDHGGVPVIHTRRSTLPGPSGVVQQVMALLQTALDQQPDLLHLFKPKGYSGLAALAVQLFKPALPLVVDTDDWEGWGGWNDLQPYPYPAKLLFAWQERDLPRRANAVTVASRTLQTQVWGLGVAPEHVVYLPNGVQRGSSTEQGGVKKEELGIKNETVSAQYEVHTTRHATLLLYTRFWEFDLVELLQALVVIVQHRPDVRLLVVGKGERGEEHELLRLAKRAGIDHAIDYRGWAAPQEVPSYFAQADIALYPIADRLINRSKSPAKLLEQMAAGLAIVAASVGEVGEFIEHGQSGLLVPPGDPAAFAQATLALLDDRELRTRLGAGAQKRVGEVFNWDRLARVAEGAYELAQQRATGCQG